MDGGEKQQEHTHAAQDTVAVAIRTCVVRTEAAKIGIERRGGICTDPDVYVVHTHDVNSICKKGFTLPAAAP